MQLWIFVQVWIAAWLVVLAEDHRQFERRQQRHLEPKEAPFKFRREQRFSFIKDYAGTTQDLDCRITGGTKGVDIKWYKDGDDLTFVDDDGILLHKFKLRKRKQLLEVRKLNKNDLGNFTCVISKGTFSLTRNYEVRQVILQMYPQKPVIVPGQPGNHTGLVGYSLTLTCEVVYIDTSDQVRMRWIKHFSNTTENYAVQDKDGNPLFTILQECSYSGLCDQASGIAMDNPMNLEISDLKLEDEGWYSCVAWNSYGSVHHSGYVQVIPHLPQDPRVSRVVVSRVMVSIVCVTVIAVILLVVSTVAYVNYRKERKQRIETYKNAKSVIKWTKRVMIMTGTSDEECEGNLLNSRVLIQKGPMTPSKSGYDWNSEWSDYPEYEFELDEKWEISWEHLKLGEVLGEGEFGRVIRGEVCVGVSAGSHGKPNGGCINSHSKNTQTAESQSQAFETYPVAIKMIKEGHTDSDVADLYKEAFIMKQIGHHENIINLIGTCVRPQGSPLFVIVELAELGNLKNFMKQQRPLDFDNEYEVPIVVNKSVFHCGSSLTLKDMANIGCQVAKGMEFLAMKKCVHRDLAARNVLVCAGNLFKVADFGMARDVQDKEYYRKVSEGKVPLKWMSPEAVFERLYSTQSDVWSYGVLLWEIFSFGENPFPNVSAETFMQYLRLGNTLSQPYACPENVYELMTDCWSYEVDRRPHWSSIVDRTRNLCAEFNGYLEIFSRRRTSSGYTSMSKE